MVLVEPSKIPEIDKYAVEVLGMQALDLMLSSGRAVACEVRKCTPSKKSVRIFAGKGNNGGDGYAAANILLGDYDVKVYDVFSQGQRTDEGKYFFDAFLSAGGRIEPLTFEEKQLRDITSATTIVDAVFGTGFLGELPDVAVKLANIFDSLPDVKKIAIDVPLGINAYDGSVILAATYHADCTVSLCFPKPGLVSYPAKEYVGTLINDNIGLQTEPILKAFPPKYYHLDRELVSTFIPIRKENSSKGTFGKLLLITGSLQYIGAAYLSLEAALRGGVGYVTYLGESELCRSLISTYPEAIYKPYSFDEINADVLSEISEITKSQSAVLIGSGSSKSNGLLSLLECLLSENGCPLILDADAINLLALDPVRGRGLIKNSVRKVILTPHPLEFSRLCEMAVENVQANRLKIAEEFAKENNCILVLKGAATIVTDGYETYINSSGSSALAKAGSGDVLAGFLASVLASGIDPLYAAALAVYYHGLAADVLSDEFSSLGVTPSDLPKAIAAQISKSQKNK